MKTFPGGAPLRLSLPWEPPVHYEYPNEWAFTIATTIDDAKLYDYFWNDRYERVGDRIYFYLRTEKRKNQLKKELRNDSSWKAFLERFPEAKLEWAEDVLENPE
jgi:hypothetical protein